MQVKIIEGCIVCRQCECQAPDVFLIPEKADTAVVLDSRPDASHEAEIIRAIKGCPVHVIRLRRRDALSKAPLAGDGNQK
jgi:ferredoxin